MVGLVAVLVAVVHGATPGGGRAGEATAAPAGMPGVRRVGFGAAARYEADEARAEQFKELIACRVVLNDARKAYSWRSK